jgi:hypothetical protein
MVYADGNIQMQSKNFMLQSGRDSCDAMRVQERMSGNSLEAVLER